MSTQQQRAEYLAAADKYAPLVMSILDGGDSKKSHVARMHGLLAGELRDHETRNAYKPLVVPPMPQQLSGLPRGNDLSDGYAVAALDKALATLKIGDLRLFVAHRNNTTEIEALNATRLHMLATAALDATEEEDMLTIANFISDNWKAHSGFGKLTTRELRAWSQRRMRDYTSLPVIWRHADLPAVKFARQEVEGD
jgi:hypothetical protein